MKNRVICMLIALAAALVVVGGAVVERPVGQHDSAYCYYVLTLFNQPIRICTSGGGSGGSW